MIISFKNVYLHFYTERFISGFSTKYLNALIFCSWHRKFFKTNKKNNSSASFSKVGAYLASTSVMKTAEKTKDIAGWQAGT